MTRGEQFFKYFPYLLAFLFFLYALNFIGYGLPLHLVGDEESFVGGALKMLELKTIAPVFHQSEFVILYYPTLLPYLYIIFWLPYFFVIYFFSPVVASLTDFSTYVLTHLDTLWMMARIPSVIAGSALIVVVYKIAQNLFPRDIRVAIFSSCLLSLSLLHLQLSIVSGHWIFDTLFFFAVLYFLIVDAFHHTKSTIMAGMFAGLGFGFSSVGFVSLSFAVLVYLVLSVRQRWFGLANIRFWYFICISLGIAAVFFALHPGAYTNVIVGSDTPGLAIKNFHFVRDEMLASLNYLFSNDFMISALSIIGLALLAVYGFARYAVVAAGMLLLYEILLIYFFHNAARYHVFLMPVQAVAAGYAVAIIFQQLKAHRLTRYFAYALVVLILVIPSVVLARYSALLWAPTTEQLAAEWVAVQASREHFIVDSPTLAFFQSDESISAQQERGRVSATARALHSIDVVRYGAQKLNYTNIHFWNASSLSRDSIEEFVRTFRPRYYIVSLADQSAESLEARRYLIQRGRLVRIFSSTDASAITEAIEPAGDLGIASQNLFRARRFGRSIAIFELTYEQNG